VVDLLPNRNEVISSISESSFSGIPHVRSTTSIAAWLWDRQQWLGRDGHSERRFIAPSQLLHGCGTDSIDEGGMIKTEVDHTPAR
jgi:hypothetical protein